METLKETYEWPKFKKRLLINAKQFPEVERCLRDKKYPSLSNAAYEVWLTTRTESATSIRTTRGSPANDPEFELYKLDLKENHERYYRHLDQASKFVGSILSKINDIMMERFMMEPKFHELTCKNEYIEIINLMEKVCTRGAINNINNLKAELWSIQQYPDTLESYCQKIEEKVEIINSIKTEITPEELGIIFLRGLNKRIFGPKIAEIESRRLMSNKSEDFTYLKLKQELRISNEIIRLQKPNTERSLHLTSKKSNTKANDNANNRSEYKRNDNIKCFNCKGYGHIASKCSSPKMPKSQESKVVQDETVLHTTDPQKNKLILDTGSTVHVINDKKLIKNLTDCETIKLNGIGNDPIYVDKKGKIPKIGEVLYCPQASANLISLTKLDKDNVKVEYDNKKRVYHKRRY